MLALPMCIPALVEKVEPGWPQQENSYMILTVDELFKKDGVTLQNDVVYYRCEDGVTTRKQRD